MLGNIISGAQKLTLMRDVRNIAPKDQATIQRLIMLMVPKLVDEEVSNQLKECENLEEMLAIAPLLYKEYVERQNTSSVAEEFEPLVCPHCDKTIHM